MIRLPLAAKYAGRARGRRKLPFPATAKLRVAQVSATARCFYSATPFPADGWTLLEGFRPQVLIGSITDLKRLASCAQARELNLASIDHAILILTPCGEEPASSAVRSLLWHSFGVPVYELLVASGGIVLASECEAYEGWHVEPGKSIAISGTQILLRLGDRKTVATGLQGEVAEEPCPCGRSGIRLVKLAASESRAERPLAAIA